jgi:hypothetical protein
LTVPAAAWSMIQISSLTPQTPWQSASLPDCGSDVSTGLKKAKAGSTQPAEGGRVEAGDRVRVEVRRGH